MSDSDGAVARHTRAAYRSRAVFPTLSAEAVCCTKSSSGKAGILAAQSPTQPSDGNIIHAKGPSGVSSAGRGKAAAWKEEEIKELMRLVPQYIKPNGMISWNDVEEAWRNLTLGIRTKASLSKKWSDIKKKISTMEVPKDPPSDQGNTSLQRKVVTVTSDTVVDASISADGNSSEVNPAVETKPGECTPASLAEVVDIESTFRKELKKAQKIGCRMTLRKTPKRVSGCHVKPIICGVNHLISNELEGKGGRLTWNKLSHLVYAGAMTVSKLGNLRNEAQLERTRLWFRNSYIECESLHRTIGKATYELNRRTQNAEVAPTAKQTRNIRMLKRKYGIQTSADIRSLVEKLKSRLQLLQSRIALRKADEGRKRVRQMPTKMLFRSISTETEPGEANVHQIRRFWKNIVGVKKSFNLGTELVAWQRSMSEIQGDDDFINHLSPEVWQKVVQKMKPWKAHGPDKLHGYWWKVFSSANAALYRLIIRHMKSGKTLPQRWITDGRIVLVHKSGSRSDPSNFRPIACLNTCYKLVTGLIAAYLDQYVRERKILYNEQIALRGGVWGCTHAHILDQTLVADAQNQKQRPISVAWIDYAKAFDSVPHSYIRWILEVMQVPVQLRTFLNNIMIQWRVKYEVKSPGGKTECSNYLGIRSGVLQGDSFSPLLFCLAMVPISHAINSVGGAYTTASGKLKGLQTSLSHLFYMDDLKLYASSPDNLTKQIRTVTSISKDINMKLNVKKCAVAHFTPKRMVDERILKDSNTSAERNIDFPMLDGEAVYKYLGIEQKLGVKEAEAWDRAEAKCCLIARKLWDSDLTFRQKVNSYNTTIIPVFKYINSCIIKGSGKYSSVLERGEHLDVKFRALLVELKSRYKASCVARLYTSAELGGYGLKSIKDAIEESTIYLWAYLCTKVELRSSLNLFVSMVNRGKRCVVSDAGSVLKTYDIDYKLEDDTSAVTVNGVSFNDAKTLARHVVELMRTANNNRRYKEWESLELAGRVLRSSANKDMIGSFAWLKAGKLSSVAVRNVLAAQEGCLITRAHPSQSHISNKSCRACGNTIETIEHVLSSCSKWLPNLYVDRHDSVARNIYHRLCTKFGLTPPHYSQKVESVLENERIKLYWNQPVQTKTIIRHNKPDILVFNKPQKEALIIEVAISWFTGIEKQIEIKRNRYCVNGNWEEDTKTPYPRGANLLRELQTEGWKVVFMPVVLGTNGETPLYLKGDLMEKVGLDRVATDDCIERMQRSAVLGTSRIIKNHLAQGNGNGAA